MGLVNVPEMIGRRFFRSETFWGKFYQAESTLRGTKLQILHTFLEQVL